MTGSGLEFDRTRIAAMVTLFLERGTAPPPSRDWSERRACAGLPMDIFFPEDVKGIDRARAVCDGCPVTAECMLAGAGQSGVWGGLTEGERRRTVLLLKKAGQPIGGTTEEPAVVDCTHCGPDPSDDGVCLCGCDAYGTWCGCLICCVKHWPDGERPCEDDETTNDDDDEHRGAEDLG